MPDFGFCADAYTARSIYQNDQECINWYPEVDQRKQEGERGYITLYPTPGLLVQVQLPDAAEVRGLYTLPGGQQMVAVCGPSVYLVNPDFSYVAIGTLFTSSGRVSIACNGLSIYMVDGGNRYTYDLVGTNGFAVVASTDGPFNAASTVDEVENIFIYNNPGTNQWAASNVSSTVTNGLSLGTKFSAADNLVTLITDHTQVYLLGEQTAEINVNQGTYPFTFGIVQSTTIQHGCAAAGSVSRLGESFAFLVSDTRGAAWVGQIVGGYQLQRISTYAIENNLLGQVLSDARSYTYQKDGHEFYVLILPTANKTWVYDASTKMWHKWLEWNLEGQWNRTRTNCGAFFGTNYVAGDYQNGKIYYLDFGTFTNDGDTIRRVRRCPHLTQELNRVFYHSLQIQFQPGVGNPPIPQPCLLITTPAQITSLPVDATYPYLYNWDDGLYGITVGSQIPIQVTIKDACNPTIIKCTGGFGLGYWFGAYLSNNTVPFNLSVFNLTQNTTLFSHTYTDLPVGTTDTQLQVDFSPYPNNNDVVAFVFSSQNLGGVGILDFTTAYGSPD